MARILKIGMILITPIFWFCASRGAKFTKTELVPLYEKEKSQISPEGFKEQIETSASQVGAKVRAAEARTRFTEKAKGKYQEESQISGGILEKDPDNTEAKAHTKESLKEKKRESTSIVLSRAKRYEESGRLRKALIGLRNGLEIAPQSTAIELRIDELSHKIDAKVSNYLNPGIAEFDKGNYIEARKEFEKVLALDPENHKANHYLKMIPTSKEGAYDLYLKGIFTYTEENYEIAISYWQEALRLDSSLKNAAKNIRRAERKLEYLKEE